MTTILTKVFSSSGPKVSRIDDITEFVKEITNSQCSTLSQFDPFLEYSGRQTVLLDLLKDWIQRNEIVMVKDVMKKFIRQYLFYFSGIRRSPGEVYREYETLMSINLAFVDMRDMTLEKASEIVFETSYEFSFDLYEYLLGKYKILDMPFHFMDYISWPLFKWSDKVELNDLSCWPQITKVLNAWVKEQVANESYFLGFFAAPKIGYRNGIALGTLIDEDEE